MTLRAECLFTKTPVSEDSGQNEKNLHVKKR